jgi:hypothetical protein
MLSHRMRQADLLPQRLRNQHLTGSPLDTPAAIVRRLGAVQAQDYLPTKWAIAQRGRDIGEADVDAALADGSIIRTHVMRPTWHFMTREDVRAWVRLTAPRVYGTTGSYLRKLKLDDRLLSKTNDVLASALRGGRQLTRAELAAALCDAGLTTEKDDKVRLAFIMMRAELDAVICSGAVRGKQFTYALFDERVPASPSFDREDAAAELARRYFSSHGPATVKDFMWWSGLTASEARAALERAREILVSSEIEGKTYWRPKRQPRAAAKRNHAFLLTTYDECFVAYRDRAPIDARRMAQLTRDIGQTIVVDERAIGTWRRIVRAKGITIQATPFAKFSRGELAAIEGAVERYARFLGAPVTVARG